MVDTTGTEGLGSGHRWRRSVRKWTHLELKWMEVAITANEAYGCGHSWN